MVIQNLGGGGGGEERNKGRYGLWDNGEYLWVYFITMQFTT